LKLQASLSAIKETKQNIKFLRQLLGRIKLWASVLAGKQHASARDAHRRLRVKAKVGFID
jgi:transposase